MNPQTTPHFFQRQSRRAKVLPWILSGLAGFIVSFALLLPLENLCGHLSAQTLTPVPTPDLEKEVNQILAEPDNVARRARIAPVFQLAARYAAAGETNKALTYYLKGLEHAPWNLEAQLSVARLLTDRGETAAGRQKAQLVWEHAETDALLLEAAKLLGKSFDAQLPKHEPWPEEPHALALVPVGPVEAWLLLNLRQELPKYLGIPVVIRQLPLDLPPPQRDSVHLKANDLRERIAKARKSPDFEALLRKLNLAKSSLANDEEVFAISEAVLKAGTDKEAARRFQEELAFLRRLGPQWDADDLGRRVGRGFNPRPGSERGYLAVTGVDLFLNDNRFVFGFAFRGANCGILSYRRFTSGLIDEPPNRERLKQRLLKQALSSTGLLFGLERCTDPTCARAYPNNLAEHDAKQPGLCSECQQAFAKRFQISVPPQQKP